MKGKKAVFFLSIIILIIVCIGVGVVLFLQRQNDKYVKTAEEDDISRYEWIEMLCEQNEMTDYQNSEPYYEDVDASNTYFPYIQSAVEWKLIDSGKKFEGDGYASGRFVALTAMKTIGEKKLQIYLETEEAITDSAYIELAIERELIEKEQLAKGLSAEECGQVLEKLKNIYFTEFWKDDYADVNYEEDVIQLSAGDVLQSNADGTKIVVTDDVRNTLEEGTVIVFEQESTGLKLARKITGVDSDGALSLGDVKIGYVVESLTVSDITELTFEDIVNYYGSAGDISAADNLNYQQVDAKLINTTVFSADVNSKGFKLSLSTEGEDGDRHLEIEVTDNATGKSVTLPIHDKVESDCEYNAEIDIDKILIGGQVQYSIWNGGLEYAEVAVDAHSTLSGEISAGTEKKIPLWKTPVPLGNGVIGVDIQVNLVLSVDGKISFEAELPVELSLYYEKDKGLRNWKPEISFENPTIEANCDASAMFGLEPTLVVLGCLNVMDAEADMGMTASAKVVTHPNSQVCAEISAAYPVITISVCGDGDADTLIGKMGLEKEWEIISSDKAPFRFGLHYEVLPDKSQQFVKECTYSEAKSAYGKGKSTYSEAKSTKEYDKPNNENDVQMSNTYYTRYKEITGIDRPEFCFDYPDGWTITREEVVEDREDDTYMQYYGELVELTNDRGACVTYTQYKMDPGSVGTGSVFRYIVEYEVEKVKDSRLKPTDISESGGLMVARIKELGGVDSEGSHYNSDWVSYAVLPCNKEGLQTTNIPGYYGMCSFYYPKPDSFQIESSYAINPYTFIAEGNGDFTEEEEKEVIAILSSFREAQ